MTNKLEKKFFEYFGVEPLELDYPDNTKFYPEVTDRFTLELLVFLANMHTIQISKVKELKKCLLKACLDSIESYPEEEKKKIKKSIKKLINRYCD